MEGNVRYASSINVRFGDKGIDFAAQSSKPPVPIEKLYEVLRDVQRRVKEELAQVAPHWKPVGTRVAYYVRDGDDTPQEYKLDEGNVDPLDAAPTEDVSEEEWSYRLKTQSKTDPLTPVFVHDLYLRVKRDLEESGHQPLGVLVAGVLEGSQSVFGEGCCCNKNTRLGSFQNGIKSCSGNPC